MTASLTSGAAAEPVIEVENLSLTFPNGRTVLRDIHFTVRQGEVFVVLGGSGCGKSTLLNILIGHLTPTTGTVRILGEDIHRLSGPELRELQSRFGVLFQSGALWQSMTVAENISLPLRVRFPHWSEALLHRTAMLKLRTVNLERHADKFPSDLSGGMKKRAGLARALALDPQIVYADEPASGLDPVSTREIDALFLSLTKKIHATAFIVTHDLASFWRIATRAILLGGERDGPRQGTILFAGTRDDFASTTQEAVREFLRSESPASTITTSTAATPA
jgi:phospholipid/cholesterol/gamma-HCH transport system ATP-binding protein